MPNEFVQELRLQVDREFWSRSYDVSAVMIQGPATPQGLKWLAAKVEWWEIPEGTRPPKLFGLDESKAQLLMDQLWALGLRPTEGAGSAGAMAAVQKHLQDMRSLVFKTVPKEPGS